MTDKHVPIVTKYGRRYHVHCRECLEPLLPAEDWPERLDTLLAENLLQREDLAVISGVSYASVGKLFAGARGFAWIMRVCPMDLTSLLEDDSCSQLAFPGMSDAALLPGTHS